MAANGNMNGNVNGYGDTSGHPCLPANQANKGQKNLHPNLDGVNRMAAFRQCNPPIYDGN